MTSSLLDDAATLAELATDWGVRVARRPVCPGHCAPLDFLEAWCLDRPSVSLVCGPRGGGKSYLRALATHLDSIRDDGHATRVLGGSLSQSEQVYDALIGFDKADPEGDFFESITRTRATYRTGSDVAILAASRTSVRGPHVPTLVLDEVDEIDDEIRQDAMGMCMERNDIPASVAMTSTWHRVGGPMERLIDAGRSGAFPVFTFCIFDVIESCPASRSGPRVDGPDLYAGCPACPLRPHCHADIRPHPDTGQVEPKAKRSSGHYAIDSLIQKVAAVSPRVFEADYLCSGPRADGLWFTTFDESVHVSPSAEYDPNLPVYWAIDCGVETGAIWAQIAPRPDGTACLRVFADYYAFDVGAEANARAILEIGRQRCHGRRDAGYIDPASGSRTAIGVNVLAEYERAGLGGLLYWPNRPGAVADGLQLLEAFVRSADGATSLAIHPRCTHLIRGFRSYRRAKRQGQWTDAPEDPQHPAEELIDALRGCLMCRFPDGRKPKSKLPTRPVWNVF